MSTYLIQSDFNKTIQDANLQQIISNDSTILDAAILAAEAECKSYLRQKYNLDFEFQPTTAWADTNSYKAGARVTNSGTIYNAIYPHPQFDFQGLYNIGDQVFWKDKTYTCKIQTPVIDHETGLQYRVYENLPYPNVQPDNIVNGVEYWGVGVPYSVPTGTAITNTTYWQQADTRDAQMVMYLIDIALFHVHSRISPRNIPDLRVKRYDAAIDWLKMCATGEITPALPLLQPKQGNRIRYGGQIKNINTY
jgi:phage gp36-like protein